MELYNNGDKVIIRSTRGMGWNPRGEMDQYCGKTLTIKKSGWSLEKVCVAEFGSRANESKLKREQLQPTKKKGSTLPKTGTSEIKSTKLEPNDEAAYQYYAQRNPGITRQQYIERTRLAQSIPHDRWE